MSTNPSLILCCTSAVMESTICGRTTGLKHLQCGNILNRNTKAVQRPFAMSAVQAFREAVATELSSYRTTSTAPKNKTLNGKQRVHSGNSGKVCIEQHTLEASFKRRVEFPLDSNKASCDYITHCVCSSFTTTMLH